jgi:hypothetical protein
MDHYTGTTERDYADKSWLRDEPDHEDAFQLIPPDVAGYILLAGLFICLVLERMGKL